MASRTATQLLQHRLIEWRRQLDLQIASALRLKVDLTEGDADLRARMDSIAESVAEASSKAQTFIDDLTQRLR